MGWRTLAAVAIVLLAVVVIQSLLAAPLYEVSDSFNASHDFSDSEHLDGNAIITSLPGAWLFMGLILIGGTMAWGVARVVRQQLTRVRR